jgi:SAM-dependent methyltransferase
MAGISQHMGTDYTDLELLYNIFMGPALEMAIDTFAGSLPDAAGSYGLDLGCGPGGLMERLDRATNAGTILGVDLSVPHLLAARQSTADLALGARTRFVAADLDRRLPLVNASVDWAWAADVLWPDLVSDPLAVVAELARVVRPGGAIGLFFGNWPRAAFMPGHARLEHLLSVATERQCFMRFVAPAAHPENALGWLRAAGLRSARFTPTLVHYQFPLDEPIRCYIPEVIFDDRRRPEVERAAKRLGVTEAEWSLWMEISDPTSRAYLLDRPDYYCLQVGALMTASVPPAAASDRVIAVQSKEVFLRDLALANDRGFRFLGNDDAQPDRQPA